jgi:hypothetical protein
MDRRSFIKIGGLTGIGSLTLPQLIAEQSKRGIKNNKSVIIIWMNGGPSHHETFDPKPEAPSEFKGHFDAISTNVPGIQISDHLEINTKHHYYDHSGRPIPILNDGSILTELI